MSVFLFCLKGGNKIESGIYKIENIVNGKLYIGQSQNIRKRWWYHRYNLKKQLGSSHLQSSWNKYGKENFVFSVIEYCEHEFLDEREIYWIKSFDSNNKTYGYNILSGGKSNRGFKLSEDSILKIKKKLTGVKKSPEAINAMKKALKRYYQTHIAINATKVICINNKTIFETLKNASEYIGVSPATIKRNCMHINKFAGFLNAYNNPAIWMFYNDFILLNLSDLEISNIIFSAKNSIKKVICLNTGELFETVSEAAKAYNLNESGIRSCCNGNYYSCGDINGERLVWKYYNLFENINFTDEEIEKYIYTANHIKCLEFNKCVKSVVCLNTHTIFKSLKEASMFYNVKSAHISSCCKHKLNSAGVSLYNNTRLVWRTLEEYKQLNNIEIKALIDFANRTRNSENNPNSKPVICLNSKRIFPSGQDAANFYGISINGIYSCCKNKSLSCGKDTISNDRLAWAYYNTYVNMSESEISRKILKALHQKAMSNDIHIVA